MGVLDLSSNKCHPLEMPNVDCTDARLRLDHRIGASVEIFNSRIFVYGGCTLEMDIPPNFTLNTINDMFTSKLSNNEAENEDENFNEYEDEDEDKGENYSNNNNDNVDYNDYLSTECFRLSLINRKWGHYSLSQSNLEIPEPRMFHSMCVYDNYIYISGGIKFNKENNKADLLNDLWRFDSIDKRWKCIHKNGNTLLSKRYDHIMIMLPNLELFDKCFIHPGICMIGGMDVNNKPHQSIDLFDISTHKVYDKNFPNLEESRQSIMNDTIEIKPLNIRNSLNAIYSGICPSSNDLKLFVFDKSPNVEEFEPIVIFSNNSTGVRYHHISNFDIKPISNIEFPTIGTFGENIIVVGFVQNELKISSFIYNLRTEIWTKLHVSCMHKIFTHKLTKGFVWESHHKISFLGSMEKKQSNGSINYFNTLILMTLPFTNFISKKSVPLMQRSRFSNSPTPSTEDLKRRTSSITSMNSNLSGSRLLQQQQQQQQQLPPEHTGDFASYAFHVAQQMQVNSIRSVLPSYAIAIGKNAFERSDALSDMDFICSDGSIIPVPLALCRRRWGIGFDELFADAYAKSYIEETANDLFESERNSSCGSFDNDDDEYSSINSKNSNSTPCFRYPFQEKNTKSDLSPTRHSYIGNAARFNSVSSNSRHNSVSGGLFPVALNRASLSLSQTRRNSSVIGVSRENSFSYVSPSRRSSLSSAAISRRASLVGLQIPQSASRRGSTLSRNSLLSSSSNSYNSGSPNPMPRHILSQQQLPQQQSSTIMGCSPNSIYSGVNAIPTTTPTDKNKVDDMLSKSMKMEDIPAQLPMPNVLPDGSPMPEDKNYNMNNSNNNNSNNNNSNSNNLNDENDVEFEPASRTLSHTSADNTFSKKTSCCCSTANSDRDHLIKSFEHSDYAIDPDTKFNPLRIPRALYLPYPRNTVHAIIEYLYSGQIGANWKLFPTGIEVLQATKQLGIQLLYDLILELFFVVLGIIESNLKDKLITLLEEKKYHDNGFNLSDDKIYKLVDTQSEDDSDLDWKLLLEAVNDSRRDSGSTITSDMKVEDNEDIIDNPLNNKLDLSNLGPTDKISSDGLITCDLSPTTSRFNDPMKEKENNNDDDEFDDTEEPRVKITIASLDENGYETSSNSDNEDNDEDDGRGETLLKSFKRFTMNGNNSNNNYNNKHKNENETGNNSNKRKKFRQWPTFKELVNDEHVNFVSETIIEMFIETGAMINDTKLMLKSIHVKDMYNKLKIFEEETKREEKIRERIIIDKIKETSNTKINDLVNKKEESQENKVNDVGRNNMDENNNNSSNNKEVYLDNKVNDTPHKEMNREATPEIMITRLNSINDNISKLASRSRSSVRSKSPSKSPSKSRSRSRSRSKSRSRSRSKSGNRLKARSQSISETVSVSSDKNARRIYNNINSDKEIPLPNTKNIEKEEKGQINEDYDTSLKKSKSSISLLSTTGSIIRNLDNFVSNNSNGIDNSFSSCTRPHSIFKRGTTPLNNNSNGNISEINNDTFSLRKIMSNTGLGNHISNDDDNQSVYSFDASKSANVNDKSNVKLSKKKRFFGRFRH